MKKMMLVWLVVLAAAVVQAAPIKFEDADKNKDGVVTKEEFIAEHKVVNPDLDKTRVSNLFTRKDKDGDGKITEAEFLSDRK